MQNNKRTHFFDELKKHLEVSVKKIIECKNQDAIEEYISDLIGFQYIDYLNLSILSGEYYFIDKEKIQKLTKQLEKILLHYINNRYLKDIIEFSINLNTLLLQLSKLLDYTKMKANLKTVKPIYKIENIIERSENTDDYLFQLNILLAEIDHDFHVSDEIEEKLNLIKQNLENNKFDESAPSKNPILIILLDKTNLLLYKLYTRKIKTLKNIFQEKDIFSNEIRLFEQKVENLKQSIGINKFYHNFL